MKTAVITVGRGIGQESALSDARWYKFTWEVLDLVNTLDGTTLYFDGDGEGQSEEWGAEDAYTIIFDLPDRHYGDLYESLQTLAEEFHQEAIALTLGATTLVRPRVHDSALD